MATVIYSQLVPAGSGTGWGIGFEGDVVIVLFDCHHWFPGSPAMGYRIGQRLNCYDCLKDKMERHR